MSNKPIVTAHFVPVWVYLFFIWFYEHSRFRLSFGILHPVNRQQLNEQGTGPCLERACQKVQKAAKNSFNMKKNNRTVATNILPNILDTKNKNCIKWKYPYCHRWPSAQSQTIIFGQFEGNYPDQKFIFIIYFFPSGFQPRTFFQFIFNNSITPIRRHASRGMTMYYPNFKMCLLLSAIERIKTARWVSGILSSVCTII